MVTQYLTMESSMTRNEIPNHMDAPLLGLRCGKNNHTKSYCKEKEVSCKHYKSQQHASRCCAFIPRATSTTNGKTSDTASTAGSKRQSRQTHSPNSPRKQKRSQNTKINRKGTVTAAPGMTDRCGCTHSTTSEE